ncbi:hypothetical protein T4E_3161 [Trichinella pseudospiralis]|uniref:Uncharacterized protein n=1 Tax=Trichinella pseudospiralis TaxID=6337 RepID=A0A0V0XX96_TRIPS|nr:hypothetical protein T4E_3161 [Trichinella pseudospiralis]
MKKRKPPLSSLYRKSYPVSLLEAGTAATTWKVGIINSIKKWMELRFLTLSGMTKDVVETLVNHLLSRDSAADCLRWKQRRIMIYTGEHTSGRLTLEHYLEALMYLTPEPT